MCIRDSLWPVDRVTNWPSDELTETRIISKLQKAQIILRNWLTRLTHSNVYYYLLSLYVSMSICILFAYWINCRHLRPVWPAVWFKLMVTVTEMTINGNKSNPLTVTVTVTKSFINCNCNWNTCNGNIELMPSWSTIRSLTYYLWLWPQENRVLVF